MIWDELWPNLHENIPHSALYDQDQVLPIVYSSIVQNLEVEILMSGSMVPSTSINNIIREQKKKKKQSPVNCWSFSTRILKITGSGLKNCLVQLTGNKEVMFHSVSRKFAKRETKLINKALFTIVVIVNVNKLS